MRFQRTDVVKVLGLHLLYLIDEILQYRRMMAMSLALQSELWVSNPTLFIPVNLTDTAPPFSRTSSANATVTSRNLQQPQTSPRPAHAALNRGSLSPKPKSRPVSTIEPPTRSPRPEPLSSPSSTSDDSSSDSDAAPLQSRLLRRPARFQANKMGQSEDGDEDDDEPAFMPFTTVSSTDIATHHDPSATLRGDPRNIARRQPLQKRSSDLGVQSHTSDSSASSTAPSRRPEPLHGIHKQRTGGPLSPRRTIELAGRSPGTKGKGREGSDGSPSMGSSFSDLDGESWMK